MQFTGLTDKDGKEIYNKDKLNISFGGNGYAKGKHLGVTVYWDKETLQYCVQGGNLKSILKTPLSCYVDAVYELINPELLK